MSTGESLNWVEKRKRTAGNLAESKCGLWRDICAALTDASRSFNELYQGKSTPLAINGNRFRVSFEECKDKEVEVDFDKQTGELMARYGRSPVGMKSFTITADHVSAFILDSEGNRVTVEQVSEAVLSLSFFG